MKGLNGTWREEADGLYSEGGGDNFALSETTASDFVFEAEATFHRQSGAATLVFFAGDQPASAAYCANIDLNRKNARIFRFGYSGGDVGSRQAEAYTGGYLGLLTWNGAGSFNRVYYLVEGEADTIALHERYVEASGYIPIAYTVASWSALEAALSDAAAVLENPAVSQGQADQALAALEAAILGLCAAPRGDIDRDGSVTVSDVVDPRRRIVAGATDPDDRLLCDLDKDGGVTVSDVVELRRMIVAGQTE